MAAPTDTPATPAGRDRHGQAVGIERDPSRMAPVMFARTWRAAIDAEMAGDAQLVARRYGLMGVMSAHAAAGSPVVMAISQPWRSRRYDWYDVAAFEEVIRCAAVGWLAVAHLSVGAEPNRDREQIENAAKLRALPAPVRASFWGGRGDCDGWLEWESPLRIDHRLVDGSSLRLSFPPSGVPLEVGHTQPETTIWHTCFEGGVGRCPYGSTFVTLLLRTTGPPQARAWPLARPVVEHGCLMLDPGLLTLSGQGPATCADS